MIVTDEYGNELCSTRVHHGQTWGEMDGDR